MTLKGKVFLITGGTGFIGKALCNFIVLNQAKVFVLTRKLHNSDKDVNYINSVSELKDTSIDTIINLAGETISQRWTAKAKDRILNSRIQITASIVNFIKSAKQKPSLFISGSAIGYYGSDKTIEFDERTTASNQKSFSHQLCASWEREALKAQKYGVRTVLLRTGVVLGKDGGMLAKLLPVFRFGLGGPIGNGQQWLSWIELEDMIRLISFIIENKTIEGPINATAPNPIQNIIFAQELAKSLRRPCFFKTPAFILRLIFGQMAEELMLEGQKVIPKGPLDSGFKFLYPTIQLSLKKIFNSK